MQRNAKEPERTSTKGRQVGGEGWRPPPDDVTVDLEKGYKPAGVCKAQMEGRRPNAQVPTPLILFPLSPRTIKHRYQLALVCSTTALPSRFKEVPAVKPTTWDSVHLWDL